MANQKHTAPTSQHERIERLTQSREHWRKRARAAEKRLMVATPAPRKMKLRELADEVCGPDIMAADIRHLTSELASTRGQLILWQFFGYSMSALAVLASCAWIYERFAT